MNKNQNKPPKKPLTQRISETLDIPVGTFGSISFIEAVGNRRLDISGCEGLLTYTSELIVLRLCDGIISIRGFDMELHGFSAGNVGISGIISSIGYGTECEHNA